MVSVGTEEGVAVPEGPEEVLEVGERVGLGGVWVGEELSRGDTLRDDLGVEEEEGVRVARPSGLPEDTGEEVELGERVGEGVEAPTL